MRIVRSGAARLAQIVLPNSLAGFQRTGGTLLGTPLLRCLAPLLALLVFLILPAGSLAQTVTSAPIAQVLTAGSVVAIAEQPDHKIIVGGGFSSVNGVPRQNLARFNADGSLDMAWNPAPMGQVSAIVVNGANEIFVGGSFTAIGGANRIGVAKLSASGAGAADPAWNAAMNPGAQGVRALALDGLGNLYVGGDFAQLGGQPRSRIARLTSAGVADPVWNPGADGLVRSIALDGSGSVFVCGGFSNLGGVPRHYVAKIGAGGVVDPVWNPMPTIPSVSGPFTSVDTVAFDPVSGGLYVGGYFSALGGQPWVNLVRLSTATGAAAPGWAPVPTGEVVAVAVDPAGNVYASGVFGTIGGQTRPGFAKVSGTTGIADASWDPLGAYFSNALAGMLNLTGPAVSAISVASNGKVLAGGSFGSMGGLTKSAFAVLSPSGQGAADPAYGSAQVPGRVLAMVRDGAGRTVIGGVFQFMGDGVTVRNNIARLLPDTTLDTTWAPEANLEVDALAVDPANNVYAGGVFSAIGGLSRKHLARLAASGGAADAAWDPAPDDRIWSLAVDGPAGLLYAGGYFTSIGGQPVPHLARVSTAGAGAADSAWKPSPDVGNGYANVGALLLDNAGHLYVGGTFLTIGGQSRSALARLSTTGTGAADGSWAPNATEGGSGAAARVSSFAVDGSGHLYVGGYFDAIGGAARKNLVRLSTAPGAAVDATWTPEPNGPVYAIALDGGDVYVGGGFAGPTYVWGTLSGTFGIGGAKRDGVARIPASGNGAADCTWIANTDNGVPALVVDGPGEISIGGSFVAVLGAAQSGFARLTGSGAGCTVAVASVNGGIDPSAGAPFTLTVESRDRLGFPQNVVGATGVGLGVTTGTGSLSGTTSCQVPAAAHACTMPGVVYSKVESGVVLTVSRTSGDSLTPGNSTPISFIAALPPIQLGVLSVNGGADPVAGTPFPIVIQAQDLHGNGANVVTDTAVQVGVTTGTGYLVPAATVKCQIPMGSSSCTASNLVYSKAEAGVVFTALAPYASGVIAGDSQEVNVQAVAGKHTLTVVAMGSAGRPFGETVISNPSGISCTSGVCSAAFPAWTPVTLSWTAPAGTTNVLASWTGACTGPTCVVTLDADKAVGTQIAGEITGNFLYANSEAVQATTTIAGQNTHRVDQPETRIVGKYQGTVVYDQTFGAAYGDLAVQAGVLAAGAAVRAAAHDPSLPVSSPVLTASGDTLLSSVRSLSDVVTGTPAAYPVNLVVGPAPLTTGDLGTCTAVRSGCPQALTTYGVGGAVYLFDMLTVDFSAQISRTVVTTETHRVAATYEVTGGTLPADTALSGLSVSAGALTPPFASGTTSYTVSVASDVATTTVTPTLHDPGATVTVNGQAVASGTPSPSLSLSPGDNVVTIVVTAQDRSTTRAYSIVVARDGDAAPAAIPTLSPAALALLAAGLAWAALGMLYRRG